MAGNTPHDPQIKFQDSYITLRFLGYDSSTGEAKFKIEERQQNIGRYYINVRFASQNSTRVDYDGANPRRPKDLIVTGATNDAVEQITVTRVGD